MLLDICFIEPIHRADLVTEIDIRHSPPVAVNHRRRLLPNQDAIGNFIYDTIFDNHFSDVSSRQTTQFPLVTDTILIEVLPDEQPVKILIPGVDDAIAIGVESCEFSISLPSLQAAKEFGDSIDDSISICIIGKKSIITGQPGCPFSLSVSRQVKTH
ncbi:hypothetical protein CCZ27_08020 [Thauera sinica]|nr:hypothetical protein CCZ27_08020 [Thauera sp. K11]